MLHLWDSVEADFMRDYGINLMEQLENMTWRRFQVLFSNLSPYGATATKADALREKMNDEPDPEHDEEQATEFFSQMLSTSKGSE